MHNTCYFSCSPMKLTYIPGVTKTVDNNIAVITFNTDSSSMAFVLHLLIDESYNCMLQTGIYDLAAEKFPGYPVLLKTEPDPALLTAKYLPGLSQPIRK